MRKNGESMQSIYQIVTPIGACTAIENDGEVIRLILPGLPAPPSAGAPQTALASQLAEYFEGRRREFTVPTKLDGPAFFTAAWQAALQIPYGETMTYARLAESAGRPDAVRACGQAMARNPLPLLVPCHRVVYAGGKRQNYLGGEAMKKYLLELEAQHK
jgi:O-6-methylguanine DNA methyltransferase